MDQPDDLLARCRRGDKEAFRQLFRTHRDDVARLAFRMTGSSSDLEDLVQEVFLQVHRSLADFRGDARFSTWLYRVTANAALMRLRSDRRRRQASLEDHVGEAEHALSLAVVMPGGEWSERADSRYDQAQRRSRLEQALSGLPEGYREVVIEHYLEGEPLQDLADRLGTTESAVRSRLR